MSGSVNISKSSGAPGQPTSPGQRRYELRQSCCLSLNITLCTQHLAERIHDGWRLDADRGADNLPCYDCNLKQTQTSPAVQAAEVPCADCHQKR